MGILNELKKSELFENLSGESLKEVASIGRAVHKPENTLIFHEEERGDVFFMLIRGMVKLYKSTEDGKEAVIRLIAPGEIFGEVILFESDLYPVSAMTIAPSELFLFPRNAFLSLLNSAHFRDEFIRSLFTKMRYLSHRIHYLSSFDVEERFFRFLSDRYGRRTFYEITIPKKEIASAIGTIPETFSRMILRLTRRGVIRWERNTLEIAAGFWEGFSGE